MDELESKIFELLTISNPSDNTGFYMLARAFQAHLEGKEVRMNEYLSQAKVEHKRHRESIKQGK